MWFGPVGRSHLKNNNNNNNNNLTFLLKCLWLVYHQRDSILYTFLWDNYHLPAIETEFQLQEGFTTTLPSFFLRDIFSLYQFLFTSIVHQSDGSLDWRWTASHPFTCKSSAYNLLINPNVYGRSRQLKIKKNYLNSPPK
jgi:hypothetical protein